jgi:hypothetical protein
MVQNGARHSTEGIRKILLITIQIWCSSFGVPLRQGNPQDKEKFEHRWWHLLWISEYLINHKNICKQRLSYYYSYLTIFKVVVQDPSQL